MLSFTRIGSTMGVSLSAIPSTEQYGEGEDGISTCVPVGGVGLDLSNTWPRGQWYTPEECTLNRTPLKKK